MPRKAVAKDVFLQFAGINVGSGGDSSVLSSAKLETGLSLRGGLAWLIHQVHLLPIPALPHAASATGVSMAVCTKEVGAMPDLNDDGVIVAHRQIHEIVTTGGVAYQTPVPYRFMPPIPIAAPTIWGYWQTDAARGAWANKNLPIRIGYTTIPLDAALWQEIAETWGW